MKSFWRKEPTMIFAVCALMAFVGVRALQRVEAQSPPSPAPVTTPTLPITEVPGAVRTVPAGQPSQPAVSVTTIPGPASPQHVPEQVMWALAASYALRYLTGKGWLSFLTPDSSARVKALCGFVAAATTAAGIHFAVTGSLLADGGAAITISGVSWDALKDIGFQWVAQQAWFDGLVKKGGVA